MFLHWQWLYQHRVRLIGLPIEQVSYVPHPRLCLKINTSDSYYFLRIIGKRASNKSANVILTSIPEMNHSHPSVRICTVLLLGLNCHQVNSLQWHWLHCKLSQWQCGSHSTFAHHLVNSVQGEPGVTLPLTFIVIMVVVIGITKDCVTGGRTT